jgi:hypothetical protein
MPNPRVIGHIARFRRDSKTLRPSKEGSPKHDEF